MERTHPYQLAFGTPEFEQDAFERIRGEAEARAVDVRDSERFLMLANVGELMRSMLPPDAGTTAVAQFGAVVLHAYNYWLAGKPTFAVNEAVVRKLLGDGAPLGSWDMTPPAPAGYVQLPRNLIFARIDETTPPEALDGFFFIMPGINDPAVPPFARLDVLLTLGVVANRPGFSVIELSTPVTAQTPGHFGDASARESGADFENVLPGGDGRLFAVTNTLEGLKLVARCFWHLTGHG